MKITESLALAEQETGNKLVDETQLAATKTQLDQLFRQAGNGNETRTLYRAVLDYRMEPQK